MRERVNAGRAGMIRAKLAISASVKFEYPMSPPDADVSWPVSVWQPAQEAAKTRRPSGSTGPPRLWSEIDEAPQAEHTVALANATAANARLALMDS
jgi:hypothetical protein